MRQRVNAIILSILIHCILFLLMTFIIPESTFRTLDEIELAFILHPKDESDIEKRLERLHDVQTTAPKNVISAKKVLYHSKKRDAEKAPITLVDSTLLVEMSQDSLQNLRLAHDILTNNTNNLRRILFRRQQLSHEILEKLTNKTDSTNIAHKILASNFSRMFFSEDKPSKLGLRDDYIEERLNSKIFGYDPNSMVDIPKLLGSIVTTVPNMTASNKSKHKKIKFTSVPTFTEVNILKTLWKKERVTQNAIYSNLDTTIKITAEDLDLVLSRMVDKGWITRKKISPQNIFKFMTPVGAVDVEMSELNRKNPVYEYTAFITRDHVLKFLDSRVYSYNSKKSESTASDSPQAAERDSLLAKLVLLLKTD